MMTGQAKMDNSTVNNADSVNNKSVDLVETDNSVDAGVATLNVTSEEINCNPKNWSSLAFVTHDSTGQTNSGLNKRQRSETWTYGLSNSQSKLNKGEILHNQQFTTDSRRFSTSFNKQDNNLHQNEDSDSDVNPLASVSHETTAKRNHAKSSSDNNTINNHTHNSTNIPNGGHSNLTVEDLSGFTDINLAASVTSAIVKVNVENHAEADGNFHLDETAETSRRPTIGSLFEWVTSSRNSVVTVPSASNPSVASLSSIKPTGLKRIRESIISTMSSASSNHRKSHSYEPFSTTALILEDRPSNLPTKPNQEAEKHRTEYEKMVENAKKIGQKDIRKKQKHLKELKKQEQAIVTSSSLWIKEILPHWQSMYQTSRTRQLWWQGLPPNVRGKVWQLAIGNELNITKELYSIMVTRAHDKLKEMNETPITDDESASFAADRENTVDLIRLDISRTFPHLCIFQQGGPYHELLHDVLGAYACYRPDVGYVQGMSFMAAMLLLNMEPANAFITFANLLNKPCQVAFFRLNEEMMQTYFATFEVFFEENLPKLFAHFKLNNLTPDMYLIDWIFTLFSKALNLDTASRIWDVFCRDGEDFLFRTAIAILKLNRDILLPMEFILAAQYLTRLPSTFTHQKLFEVIVDVTMTSRGNRRWKDVLSLMRDTT